MCAGKKGGHLQEEEHGWREQRVCAAEGLREDHVGLRADGREVWQRLHARRERLHRPAAVDIPPAAEAEAGDVANAALV